MKCLAHSVVCDLDILFAFAPENSNRIGRGIDRPIHLRECFCLKPTSILLRSQTDLACLPCKDGLADNNVATLAAEDLGQIAIELQRIDGKATNMAENGIDVRRAHELVRAHAARNATTAHHECTVGMHGAQKPRFFAIDGASVIRIEADEEFVFFVVRCQIVEQHAELAIHVADILLVQQLIAMRCLKKDGCRFGGGH